MFSGERQRCRALAATCRRRESGQSGGIVTATHQSAAQRSAAQCSDSQDLSGALDARRARQDHQHAAQLDGQADAAQGELRLVLALQLQVGRWVQGRWASDAHGCTWAGPPANDATRGLAASSHCPGPGQRRSRTTSVPSGPLLGTHRNARHALQQYGSNGGAQPVRQQAKADSRMVCSAQLTSCSVLTLPWMDSIATAARQKSRLSRMTLQVSRRACRLVATCLGQGGGRNGCHKARVEQSGAERSSRGGLPLGGHLLVGEEGEEGQRAG